MYGQESFLDYIKEQESKGVINLMIDSGAFTKHNSKSKMQHINVDDYCNFLQEWKDHCEKYVMLDVVGDAEQSRKNYETMLSKGLNPMFVATMFDKDYDYIRAAVNRNPDICVAGGVTTKGKWMLKRFQDIYRETDGKARMHGLGYFTFPNMLRLNLASIDASSYKTAAARFGQVIVFSEKEKRTYRIWRKDIEKKKLTFSLEVRKHLRQHGITPEMFLNDELQTCESSIVFYLNIVSSIKLQKYCRRNGLDYFLSVGSLDDLKKIIWVSEHIDDTTYQKFINEFGV